MNAYRINYQFANKDGALRGGAHIIEALNPEEATQKFKDQNAATLKYLHITGVKAVAVDITPPTPKKK